ncbi:aldo/keto reductase [Leucobacter luti]|uniref:Aryl-alcohol dehydrogenase-like predicted oxidoreductase n=1 Tax=Leucobacter luti TaxID=340320 RepID=A0A4Q7U558_9MICO|nr:aldo/keto reductase [Leucobacter luti]MBL3701015.1 aldo/keto reductase [Leucobacter luti]RZT68764.1 aryl-alcohol dehydrogenase-like predicted oxidoreductase [Leucobacter luti]
MTFTGVVPKRRLGPGGPEVPVFALGSWNTWDRMAPPERRALMGRAVEVGAAFFDVAYYNMGPHAEASRTDLLFGETLRELGLARTDYQLCGKLWLWEYPEAGFAEQMRVSLDRIGAGRGGPESFETVVVGDFMGEIDIAQVVRDVQAEIDRGSFASWGVNNWPAEALQLALDTAAAERLTPPSFAQLKYGLVRRSMAEGEFYGGWCADGTLALQASDSFEGGILVGKLAPARKIGADVGGIRERIVAAYPEVERVATDFGATPAQLGLAFCLANPATANVLFGASRVAQLDDNLGAIGVLERVGPDAIRAATAGLWLDRDVRADGVWAP